MLLSRWTKPHWRKGLMPNGVPQRIVAQWTNEEYRLNGADTDRGEIFIRRAARRARRPRRCDRKTYRQSTRCRRTRRWYRSCRGRLRTIRAGRTGASRVFASGARIAATRSLRDHDDEPRSARRTHRHAAARDRDRLSKRSREPRFGECPVTPLFDEAIADRIVVRDQGGIIKKGHLLELPG